MVAAVSGYKILRYEEWRPAVGEMLGYVGPLLHTLETRLDGSGIVCCLTSHCARYPGEVNLK